MFVERHRRFQCDDAPANNLRRQFDACQILRQLQYLPAETLAATKVPAPVSWTCCAFCPSMNKQPHSGRCRRRQNGAASDRRLFTTRGRHAIFGREVGDLLEKMTSKWSATKPLQNYHQLVRNRCHDKLCPMTRSPPKLITATGSTVANPTANTSYRHVDVERMCGDDFASSFWGARLQCAKWVTTIPSDNVGRKTTIYDFGAFHFHSRRSDAKRTTRRRCYVYTRFRRNVTNHGHREQVMAPWLPQTGTIESHDGHDVERRSRKWLGPSRNPLFRGLKPKPDFGATCCARGSSIRSMISVIRSTVQRGPAPMRRGDFVRSDGLRPKTPCCWRCLF